MNSKLAYKLLGIFILLALIMTACGNFGVQRQIIGQWEIKNVELDLSMVFDFQEDGNLMVSVADLQMEGTYTWLPGDVIKITMIQNGQSNEILGPVQIKGDQLMITNDRGETETLTRVK